MATTVTATVVVMAFAVVVVVVVVVAVVVVFAVVALIETVCAYAGSGKVGGVQCRRGCGDRCCVDGVSW